MFLRTGLKFQREDFKFRLRGVYCKDRKRMVFKASSRFVVESLRESVIWVRLTYIFIITFNFLITTFDSKGNFKLWWLHREAISFRYIRINPINLIQKLIYHNTFFDEKIRHFSIFFHYFSSNYFKSKRFFSILMIAFEKSHQYLSEAILIWLIKTVDLWKYVSLTSWEGMVKLRHTLLVWTSCITRQWFPLFAILHTSFKCQKKQN